VGLDQNRSVDEIRRAVEQSGKPGEFTVAVLPREAAPARKTTTSDAEKFVLSITGKDRPGVVSRISAYLASRGINVEDCYAYRQGEEFILVGQVMVPRHVDLRQIQIDLEALPMGGGLEIRLQHEDIFVATNEIEFRHKDVRAGQG
jgi:predicted amino acid-binding ACT domain protein